MLWTFITWAWEDFVTKQRANRRFCNQGFMKNFERVFETLEFPRKREHCSDTGSHQGCMIHSVLGLRCTIFHSVVFSSRDCFENFLMLWFQICSNFIATPCTQASANNSSGRLRASQIFSILVGWLCIQSVSGRLDDSARNHGWCLHASHRLQLVPLSRYPCCPFLPFSVSLISCPHETFIAMIYVVSCGFFSASRHWLWLQIHILEWFTI